MDVGAASLAARVAWRKEFTIELIASDDACCSYYRSKAPSMIGFMIGRLSEETGVNIETIRYYERIGLMAKPSRSGNGRRLYHAASTRRLSFIRA